MILLHSSVLSAVMAQQPNLDVLAWLNEQSAGALHVSTVTVARLAAAVGRTPAFQKKPKLTVQLDELLQQIFDDRVLPFTVDHALQVAVISATADRRGVDLADEDAALAALASLARLTVATLDPAPFVAAGIAVQVPGQRPDPSRA